MNEHLISYEFAGLRLFPESLQLEISESGKKINLSPTHCRFLLVLVQNSRCVVSYDELRKNVWTQSKELDQSLKRLIQTTKGDVIRTLKQAGINENLIENIPGQGYRLNADVEFHSVNEPFSEEKENIENISELSESEKKVFFSHSAFAATAGLFYGLLFTIGLVLETAYRFGDFAENILRLLFPMLLWNGLAMFFALYITDDFLRRDRRHTLFSGIAVLCIGAFLSCWIGSAVLPDESVTAATFQTQPASAAFIKNVLFYFLPLGVLLILLPFYAVSGRSAGRKVFTVPPAMLLGAWFLMLIYSLLSTFYLFDNLLPTEYRNLFIITAIFRFVIYFGLSLGVILYYFSKLKSNDAIEKEEKKYNRHFAVLIGLAAISFGFYFANQSVEKIPKLYSVEIKTPRDAENRLFVNIAGKNFESENLQIRVIGGDCPPITPCTVPNGALKKHSTITTDYVENIPLTLPSGDFYILAQNGVSKMSGSILLSVP